MPDLQQYIDAGRVKETDIKSVTRDDCADVIRRLFMAGCEPSRDFNEHRLQQVGIYNENLIYLIQDVQFRSQTDFHDLFMTFVL